jgi:hypothetical protein
VTSAVAALPAGVGEAARRVAVEGAEVVGDVERNLPYELFNKIATRLGGIGWMRVGFDGI